MKKTKLFLAVLAAAAVLGGCKKNAPETEKATEPPTETEAVTNAAPTAPPTEAPTETEREDSMNKTRELKGLVVSNSADKLTIQTERGKQLEFTITGADIQLSGGIQAGGNVKLLYKGRISGTDTSGARVLMVVDLDVNETPVTEGEPMTEAEYSDPEAGSGVLGGTIEDLSAERIVILADDGDSYYFSTYVTKVNLVNGLQKGNYVTVEYTGDLHGPDLVPADSITDNDPAAGDKTVKAGPSAGDFSYITGTVTDLSLSTVSISTDEGNDYTFDTSKATQCLTYGLTTGNYVTIEYTGSMEDGNTTGVEVHAVYDYEEEGSDDGQATDGADGGSDDGQTTDGADVGNDSQTSDGGSAGSDDGQTTDGADGGSGDGSASDGAESSDDGGDDAA